MTRLAPSIIAVAGLLLAAALPPAFAREPNVVFILTDNHGDWTLGCYGNPDIRTPHIDRLAAGGVRFANSFCNNAVCSPTRATYLTGLMPSQHGVHNYLRGGNLQTGPEARNTLDRFTSLPEILKGRGYACGLVGKWHLGANASPQEGLDDYWITTPHGATGTFHNAPIIEDGKIRKEPEHLTTFWTNHAVRFIDENAKEPFFLYLAFNGPYGLSRYQTEDLRGPRAADYADAAMTSFPGGVIHPWQLQNREYFGNRTAQRRYAAELAAIDDGVGAVMAALERHGLTDDTLVIFAADQGWAGGQNGLWGMGDHTRPLNAFESSMRIPLIFHHPGTIPAGRVPEIHTSNYDFVPSVLGYLGIENALDGNPPSPGRDYSPVLRGESIDAWTNEVFYEYENLRCIRTERWKLVDRFGEGLDELYDLKSDPTERTNLLALHSSQSDGGAADPATAEIRVPLQDRLNAFFRKHATAEYDLWHGGGSQTRTIVWGKDATTPPRRGRAPSPFDPDFRPPAFQLPDGFVAEVVAAPPLVRHPLAAIHDDRGRLFVAEAAGVNLKKAELEKELPNFVRMLEDTDSDGVYDRSTVFADKMTFPQGVLWLDGSLFVASPPSIWKLTDTDDDGVADERIEIATGFDYTGNAADVHGPFAGPDGRIYWCHGRKAHEVRGPDGTILSQGKAARIWSCLPDGSGVEPYAGGGMDNPVEIDFTSDGEMIGSVNLFYGRPRGDVLVHWLRGGRYPRRDQQAVLEEFKATGPLLTEAHNFGHVAVSGMCIAKGPPFRNESNDEFDVLTTHFNTQEITRTTLGWDGATLASRRNETIIRIDNPDVHLTDVLEDGDGSLLLVDTGGWFRIGCPNSQIAKPEIPGAIYRIRPAGVYKAPVNPPAARPQLPLPATGTLLAALDGPEPRAARRAAESLGRQRERSAIDPLVRRLATRPGRSLEHSLLWALIEIDDFAATQIALAEHPAAMPAGLWAQDQMDSSKLTADMILPWIGNGGAAVEIAKRHPDWAPAIAKWFGEGPLDAGASAAFGSLAPVMIDDKSMQGIVTHLLTRPGSATMGWEILAGLPKPMQPLPAWEAALRQALATAEPASKEPALRAAARLPSDAVHAALETITTDETQPARLRLLALRAVNRDERKLDAAAFALLTSLLGDGASPADRATAVMILQSAALTSPQLVDLASKLSEAGPVEFPGLVQAFARNRTAPVGEAFATAIASAPAAGSMAPVEIERILNRFPVESTSAARMRLRSLRQESAERVERLASLAARVDTDGNPQRGKALFDSGAGACVTCHRVGERGIALGPDLTTIGHIRQSRDLLESILFPNASLARDFEAYLVETTDGVTQMGLVRAESAHALTLGLPGGITTEVPRGKIKSLRAAPVSLMPAGLDGTIDDQQLLDLVAYLRSLR